MQQSDGDKLTPNGRLIMESLGLRMKTNMRDIIGKMRVNNRKYVQVMTTNKTRTIESAESYLKGILGVWNKNLPVQIENDDYLLNYVERCDKFQVEIENNRTACSEISEFDARSKAYNNMIRSFGSRLGIQAFAIEISKILSIFLRRSFLIEIN